MRPPPTLWGIRFIEPGVESDYREWRAGHVRPFVRFSMYAATSAALCAFVAVAAGALGGDWRWPALGLIGVQILLHLRGAVAVQRTPTTATITLWCGLVNFSGGFLALLLTMTVHEYAVTAACVTMSAYFGLTMFRLPPRAALLSVTPYIVATILVTIWWRLQGEIAYYQLVIGVFIPFTSLLTGMLVNLAMEWITRQTYLDHVTIQEQHRELFEERTAMARFLSPELSDTLHHSGIEAAMETKMHSLSAVSIDLRGFTTYTQRNGAEAMVAVLKEYYEAVIECAGDFGATVKDFAGDGALILIGAPVPRPDHPRAALTLARELMVRVREVTTRWGSTSTPLGAGIGIASGECAVGAIGSTAQLEYAAVGTAVNLSTRLCDVAKDGQILMGPGTARALEEAPGWRRTVLTLSGIPDSVEVTIEDTLERYSPVIPIQSAHEIEGRTGPLALPG